MTYINIARCMGPVSTFWTRGFWACSSNQWLPGLIACDQLQTIRGPGLSISRDDMGWLHFVFFGFLLMVFECFSYFFMPFRSSHDTSRFFRRVARSASRMSNDEFFTTNRISHGSPLAVEGKAKTSKHTCFKKMHVRFKVCWIWAPDVSKCFKFCQVATAQTSWRWPSHWVGRITLRGELL